MKPQLLPGTKNDLTTYRQKDPFPHPYGHYVLDLKHMLTVLSTEVPNPTGC
jgi:hypothetical protein